MFEYSAEPFVGFKDLQVIDAVSPGKGEEHEREDHPGVCPSLRRTEGEMASDALGEAECACQVQIEGQTCERGHSCRFLLFFILVGKDTLWHNRSTSLVMELCLANLFYHPCLQGPTRFFIILGGGFGEKCRRRNSYPSPFFTPVLL